mmetsp:Transcript_45472/g.38335  ORF Transcript_45472/g.38335 Transcript_45472/m.38335 type:complete len:94 (+) Transcript_45472:100-381(+)
MDIRFRRKKSKRLVRPASLWEGISDFSVVLYSLWDFKTAKGIGGKGWQPALPVEYAGNGKANTSVVLGGDCKNTPGQACCKRNCNDCAVHTEE